MHRLVLPLLACLVLVAAPSASAQVPDPEEAVALVCGIDPTLRDTLPVCPPEDPAPQEPVEEEHQHPGTPEDVPALAEEAAGTVQDIVEDPASAPGEVAGLVATIIQFVKDLLQIPVVGLSASADAATTVFDGLDASAQALAEGATAASDATVATAQAVAQGVAFAYDAAVAGAQATYDAAGDLLTVVVDFFRSPAADDATSAKAPSLPVDTVKDATGALDALREDLTRSLDAAAP